MAERYPKPQVQATIQFTAVNRIVAMEVAWRILRLCILALAIRIQAQSQSTDPEVLAAASARAEKTFLSARKAWQSQHGGAGQSANRETAWVFGRACFDWAEVATNDTQRASIAEEGIAACRPLVKAAPELAAGHYYLAMNLGQLARTKMLGALKLVSEMEREFKTARSLDPRFDYAGADRCLGLLYLDAPGWPASVGDKTKARHHLLLAVEVAADHPENHLCLLEAAIRWHDRKLIDHELAKLTELMPKARERLKGETWAASWVDWERRWKQAQAAAASPKAPGGRR